MQLKVQSAEAHLRSTVSKQLAEQKKTVTRKRKQYVCRSVESTSILMSYQLLDDFEDKLKTEKKVRFAVFKRVRRTRKSAANNAVATPDNNKSITTTE